MLTSHIVTAAPESAPVELDAELVRRYVAVLDAGSELRDYLVVLSPERRIAIEGGIAGVERGASRALAASGLHPTARSDAEEVTR